MCFWSKTEQTSKTTLETAESIKHLVLVEDIYFGFWDTWTPASLKQDLRHDRETTRWFFFLFFGKRRCFYMRNTVCIVQDVITFINLNSDFILLAHFIICIFLLYRLNIFYVNSWLFPLWTVLKPPNNWWWINCAPLS